MHRERAIESQAAADLRRTAAVAVLVCLLGSMSTASAQEERWLAVGGLGIGAGLAGPAGGVVADVAFAVDGRTLTASADNGRTWTSLDGGESWTPASGLLGPRVVPDEAAADAPEPDARIVRHPFRAGTFFALARSLWLSVDDGGSWVEIAGSDDAPLIGVEQRAIAFDPLNADRIFVANAFGLWRSSDLGMTWYGLNAALPNFPRIRFEPGPRGAPPRVVSPRLGIAELAPGFGVWRRTAVGDPAEAPLAADLPGDPAAIWSDPENPQTLVAVLAVADGPRVWRSLNGGETWDDLTADLPFGTLSSVTASAETGAIYVAGEAGVFYAESDLRNPAPASPWTSVTGSLPSAAIDDVYLEPASGRLYASVSGYGVYRRRAPHVLGRLRALNAADLSTRPVAPGGLVTVQGAAVGAASVEGAPAPVLAAGAAEAQIQIPFQASGSQVALDLTTAAGPRTLTLPFDDVSPAIFVDRGEPLVLRAATGRLLDLANPARGGDRLLVLAAGLGAVAPPWPAGTPAPLENPPAAVANVGARLNGVPLRVASAALAGGYVGAYLVEVELPTALNAGPAELVLDAGGRTSNAVRLFVSP